MPRFEGIEILRRGESESGRFGVRKDSPIRVNINGNPESSIRLLIKKTVIVKLLNGAIITLLKSETISTKEIF